MLARPARHPVSVENAVAVTGIIGVAALALAFLAQLLAAADLRITAVSGLIVLATLMLLSARGKLLTPPQIAAAAAVVALYVVVRGVIDGLATPMTTALDAAVAVATLAAGLIVAARATPAD